MRMVPDSWSMLYTVGVQHVKQEDRCWSENNSGPRKVNYWLVGTGYRNGKAFCGHSLVSSELFT